MKPALLLLLLLPLQPLRAQKTFDTRKATTGQLTPAAFDSLKQHLTRYSDGPLRDTLFLKFDFNRESCWNRLDEQGNEHNRSFVANKQRRMADMRAARTGASFIELREPGKRFNKLKSFDSTIKTDDGYLRALLFRKRATCGTSALILPSGQYILLPGDPHFEVRYWDRATIEAVLDRK
ncbi:hypothetical protein [Flaviaesturariibacter amylovorans]|uniref:Uncharacterized protein n=1 Tax=Flaviaesturariibacter amylovorans TaxID=1084520 RepID=A0ABP8HFV4_9BACT